MQNQVGLAFGLEFSIFLLTFLVFTGLKAQSCWSSAGLERLGMKPSLAGPGQRNSEREPAIRNNKLNCEHKIFIEISINSRNNNGECEIKKCCHTIALP